MNTDTPDTHYDYENQAWIKYGKYVDCGHIPETLPNCGCYGKLNKGMEAIPIEIMLETYPNGQSEYIRKYQ